MHAKPTEKEIDSVKRWRSHARIFEAKEPLRSWLFRRLNFTRWFGRTWNPLLSALSDSRRYCEQLERLSERRAKRGQLLDVRQNGVSLATLVQDKTSLGKRLAQATASSQYEFSPARQRWVVLDKKRLLYSFEVTDLLVHGVVADVLSEATRACVSRNVFSYFKGLSQWQAVRSFAAYVREHRRERPDPKTRGLYVLRRDVREYSESIPVYGRSPLWKQVRESLTEQYGTGAVSEATWQLLESVIRPTIQSEDGALFTPVRGIPTGSPVVPVLNNLYLTPLDQELGRVPGAFYARFCDDFLFAHPDAEVTRAAITSIDRTLSRLELQVNLKKAKNLYFTRAGRKSERWPEVTPTSDVEFLGCRISFEGTVGLKTEKVRHLLSDLRSRAFNGARALKGLPVEVAGPAVCGILSQALDPRSELAHAAAVALRAAVTDRRQLRRIDYWLARLVIRTLTGCAGARGFRIVPYRTIRRDWKLVSLVAARNRRSK